MCSRIFCTLSRCVFAPPLAPEDLAHWLLRVRLFADAVDRVPYYWCLYHAAVEAKALGYKAMTAEFGVAGGKGLVCLLKQRKEIGGTFNTEIVVTGFDAGSGLPASGDLRDLLHCWPAVSFVMDQNALERRTEGEAEMIIGDVGTTITGWNIRADAPLGAIRFDLDMYSSTCGALTVFDKENLLSACGAILTTSAPNQRALGPIGSASVKRSGNFT